MSALDRTGNVNDLRWWQKGLVISAWVAFAAMALTLAALLADDLRNGIQ